MTAELISIQNRPGQSPIRVHRYDCGHEHRGILLTPPEHCLQCRTVRWFEEDAERQRQAALNQNANRARLAAEKAHTYGKRHLICTLCFLGRSVDAKTLTEVHAGIFIPARKIRGVKE